MNRKYIVLFLVFLLIFVGCGIYDLADSTISNSTGYVESSSSTEQTVIDSTINTENSESPSEETIITEETPTNNPTKNPNENESITNKPTVSETVPTIPTILPTFPTKTTLPTIPPKETIPEEDKISIDEVMLCSSFGFYKGSKNMSKISSITFCREAPKRYDECWNANVSDTSDIKGYLVGTDVFIVGKCIYTNYSCSRMFAAYNSYGDALWSNLTEINGLELLNTSYTNNMTMMFAFSKLNELNGIGGWNVSNVKKFSGMFQSNDNAGDIKFTYLDVGRWNTSSAEDMSHIFYGCSLMEYIPIENWNVSRVKTFSHMFADCYSLKSVDFSRWNTSSARSFDGFLNDCRSLVTVNVSNFNTRNCNQFSQMFEMCINLEHIIGLENWDVSNASNYAFTETFHCCYKLREVNIGGWIAAPDNTARMFKDCYSLTEIDISGFDMSNTVHTVEMFTNCNAVVKYE